MNTLFLQLASADKDLSLARAWYREGDELENVSELALAELAVKFSSIPTVVFIPASHCLLTSVAANSRQLKQVGHSLAWLIEDIVADDVNDLHVIAASSQEENASLIAVSQHYLNHVLTQLRDSGLLPVAVLPDIFLLAYEKNDTDEPLWQISPWVDEQVVIRTSEFKGSIFPQSTLSLLLTAAWQESEKPSAITMAAGDSLTATITEWAAANRISTTFHQLPRIEESVLSKTDWTRHSANFLQGIYSASHRFTMPRLWKIAAMFLAVAFSVQLLSEWIQWGYYNTQAKKKQAEAVAVYKKLYPEDRRIVNLERQIKSRLDGGSQQGNALSTLTRVAEALKASGLNAQRIDYVGSALTLDVIAQAVGEIDRFQAKLNELGFRAEIVSANTQGTVVRGRVRVEG